MPYPSFKIVRHTRTTNAGLCPVYLRLTYMGRHKFFPTGLKVAPGDWDEKAGRFKKSATGWREGNDLLRTIEQRTSDCLTGLLRQGLPFSFDRVGREAFHGAAQPVMQMKVSDLVREVAAHFASMEQVGNADKYETLARVLDGFGSYFVSDMNPGWLASFEKYLRKVRGNTDGGVLHTMRTLRAACNWAMKFREARRDWYPFDGYTLRKPAKDSGSRALSIEDFRKIEALTPPDGLRFIHDLFCLSFYLWGANMADMARLTKKSLVAGRIEYVREKTKRTSRKSYSLPISEKVQAILDRWWGDAARVGDYLLPIIEAGRPERACVHNTTRRALKGLKHLAVLAGVSPEGLSMYSARHTFASALAAKGTDLTVIRDLLGHEDLRTTQAYVKKHSLGSLDAAAAEVM